MAEVALPPSGGGNRSNLIFDTNIIDQNSISQFNSMFYHYFTFITPPVSVLDISSLLILRVSGDFGEGKVFENISSSQIGAGYKSNSVDSLLKAK